MPRRAHVERSTTVAAPPPTVFALVNGFRTFTQWSAWAKADPQARFRFAGPDFGVGARMSWHGNPRTVGAGSQRIVESVPFERVRSVLELRTGGEAEIAFHLTAEGGRTRVTWVLERDRGRNPFGRLLGPWFETRLRARYDRDLAALRDEAASVLASERPLAGRWSRFHTNRFDPRLSPEQREALERLESLSYARGSRPARERPTITVHDRTRAFAGLNFYTSGHAPEAVLMGMDGRELHRWRHDFWTIWPDFPVGIELPATQFWRRAHLYPNGDVLAVFDGLGLIKLDRDSKLIWALPCRAHHDLKVRPDGTIWVLTREAKLAPQFSPGVPVFEDFVSVLTPDGREVRRVSLLECFVNSPFFEQLRPRAERARFTLGANTLAVLDGRAERAQPAFRAGNVLVSFLTIDTLAIFDLGRRKLVWVGTGPFMNQHDPRIVNGGRLLLFDNQGLGPQSRILELDPTTGRTAWTYQGTPQAPFYSETCGAVDRLPNGNTLITESDGGRAFEVTPNGQIVWEFYNPHRAGEQEQLIATLFEVVRLPPDFAAVWARGAGAPATAGSAAAR